MCLSDGIATKVYKRLKELRLRIGQDVSVMSFDCSLEGKQLTPKLTGVSFSKAELGSEAVNVLSEISENSSSTKTILLSVSIEEHDSVAKLN